MIEIRQRIFRKLSDSSGAVIAGHASFRSKLARNSSFTTPGSRLRLVQSLARGSFLILNIQTSVHQKFSFSAN